MNISSFSTSYFCHLGWEALALAAHVKSRSPTAISKQAAHKQFIYLTCQTEDESEEEENVRKLITQQNGESHLLLLTKKKKKTLSDQR